MNQFSKNNDIKLNKLSLQIGQAEAVIETYTQEKDEAWEEVKALMFEVSQEKSPRFIASDGYSLQLQFREGTPKLDEAMLQALLFQRVERREATKLWNQITKRVIDPVALEAAVRTQKVPQDIVDECLTPAKGTHARIRREWTKDDKERARILGISKD